MKQTETLILADAMDILARDIQSGDGIANAAIAEAAERLRELDRRIRDNHERAEGEARRLSVAHG